MSHSSFMKIYLRCSNAKTVENSDFSQKIHYVLIFRRFLILKGFKIAQLVQELRQFCWMGRLCLFVELHQEGSAPAACAIGLFSLYIKKKQIMRHIFLKARSQNKLSFRIMRLSKKNNALFALVLSCKGLKPQNLQ